MVEPSIPIDLAEIPTIRFQQFVGDFPLPPPGHVQVGYLPGSGLVARFPNGDYAGLSGIAPAGPPGPTGVTGPSGPAGPQGPAGPAGSGGSVISGTGGVVETVNDPFHTGGVTLSPAAGRAIRLNGPVTDASDNPFPAAGPTGPQGPSGLGQLTVSTKTANYSVTAGDTGTLFLLAADGITLTLPVTVAGLVYTFVSVAGTLVSGVHVVPQSGDRLLWDYTGTPGIDGQGVTDNFGAAQPGSVVQLVGDGDLGWVVTALSSGGNWSRG